MFDNIGQKLQGLAKFVFGLGIVSFAILGFMSFEANCKLTESVFLAILILALTIGFGCLISYLAVMLLYAFGTLVDDTAALRKKLCGEQTEVPQEPAPQVSQESAPQVPQESADEEYPIYTRVGETTAQLWGETNLRCDYCHRIQFRGNKVCNHCGARFTFLHR